MIKETGPAIALCKCFFCGEDNELVIQMKNITFKSSRVEAMHGKVISMSPCNECKAFMQKGVILITIDPAKSEKDWNKPPVSSFGEEQRGWMPNPYRTGGWFVVTENCINRMMAKDTPMRVWALKHRWMFIEHEAAEKMGLFKATPTVKENKE